MMSRHIKLRRKLLQWEVLCAQRIHQHQPLTQKTILIHLTCLMHQRQWWISWHFSSTAPHARPILHTEWGLRATLKWIPNKDGSMRCGKKGRKRDLSKPRPFHCQSCDKSFTEERFLKAHVESSHKKVRHACHLCDKDFSQKSVLSRHIKTVHDVISKQCCVTCGLTFSQKNILVRHIKTVHNKLKTHMCSDCGKMFREARELKRHFDAVHIGLKPFKCQVCDKMFSQSVHRDAHIKNVHQVSPL